jgi:hypothetical protein
MNDESQKQPRGIRLYKQVLKAQGWKGLVKELGWKVALALFMFFLIKGLLWLALFYGGFEAIKSCG